MSRQGRHASLTVVAYHYVRDLANTPYPGIKARRVEEFRGQLDYLARHYTFCDAAQVAAACHGSGRLPPNACLLTFDDGVADCYHVVLPVLRQRGIRGIFFVPAQTVEQREVLDVHKMHFVLAVTQDYEHLLAEIAELAKPLLPPGGEDVFTAPAPPGRFDPPVVTRIKRLMQRLLPKAVRAQVAAELFRRHVTRDQAGFARGLYMNVEQLQSMVAAGMTIGGHSYHHPWLEDEPRAQQEQEIGRTRQFLERVYGHLPRHWTWAYPFGSYNRHTIDLLETAGCGLAFTAHVGVVNDLSKPLELCRLDTNDLPLEAGAPLSPWTLEARGRAVKPGL